MNLLRVLFFSFVMSILHAQSPFPYSVYLEPVKVDDFPGIHSYAFGRINGNILLFGGRRDGLHARQPFAAFPASYSNESIIWVNVENALFSMTQMDNLPESLKEQLSSTNMNFYQKGTDLFIIGGYGFSASRNEHITYPYLTIIDLLGLENAIIEKSDISSFFRQVENERFAVTGGQLAMLRDTLMLVGGHRFDGRYNPMGGPSFTQAYTNQIRKFVVDYSNNGIAYTELTPITDPIHLHRRDYNLLPMIYPNNEMGYLISSGVFQLTADLPFLYPVEVYADSIAPKTEFNQYLSNYHGAKVSLFEAQTSSMHGLFFGGISQYYFEGDELVQDDLVPFVSTISRLTRDSSGTFEEHRLNMDMPGLLAASAEFILNPELPQSTHKVVYLNDLSNDSTLLGYIIGGIESPERNPFSNNRTNVTSADSKIWAVYLIKDVTSSFTAVAGYHDLSLEIFPNPTTQGQFQVKYDLSKDSQVEYLITDVNGKIVLAGDLLGVKGENNHTISFGSLSAGLYILTLIVDHKNYVSKRILKQ